jgi:aldehyde:ferredoxin oxidoreductase
MLDVATSSTSTLDTANIATPPQLFGIEPLADQFSPDDVARVVAGTKGRRALEDSLVMCSFTCRGSSNKLLTDCLNAVTGWDWDGGEVSQFGHMVSNLLRCFDIRHGRNLQKERLSSRYSSTPTDGPAKGKSVSLCWEQMVAKLYENMGWDKTSGIPLPETLKKVGLDWVIKDIYPDYTVPAR